MNDIEQRSYIKTRSALNDSPVKIHQDLVDVYKDKAYSYVTVTRWFRRFKNGREEVIDDPRSGRPVTETTKANIELVEALLKENPCLSYNDLEELTSICRGTLENIILVHLNMRKIGCRWIPHELSEKNKKKRYEFALAMLDKLNTGKWRLDQIITGDESWFYHRKINKHSMNLTWKKRGEPPDVLVKRQKNEPKSLICIFFRTTGPLLIHAVNKGETIDHAYYINNCLTPLIRTLKKRRKGSGLRGLKILHDNARPHTHKATVNFLESHGMTIISHPPYSPDLAPSDYWLFDHIKQKLDSEVDAKSLVRSITRILKKIPLSEYKKTFRKYIERLEYCVKAKGDYFEHLMK